MSYPHNLQYLARRLNNFSKSTVRIQSLNATTLGPSQVLQFDMPINSLCMLESLCLHFKGTTTSSSGGVCFPRNIECLIDSISIECNGVHVQTINNYGLLFSAIADLTLGQDAQCRRSVMQNAGDQGVPVGTVASQPFSIHNFLGFLGSVHPNVLNTSIAGLVRVRITFANAGQCLIASSNAANANYRLDDLYLSCDVCAIDDGVFTKLHTQLLERGGVFELPFRSWTSFTSVGGLSQSTKFSISSNSVNRLLAFFVPGQTYPIVEGSGAGYDPTAATSSYFKRIAKGTVNWGTSDQNKRPITYNLTSWQFSFNNGYYPQWKPDAATAFSLLTNSIHTSQDTLGGTYKKLNSLEAWEGSFWVAGVELEHGDKNFVSGQNSVGATASGSFETQGTISPGALVGNPIANPENSLTCYVYVETTMIARFGANRQIEIIQ